MCVHCLSLLAMSHLLSTRSPELLCTQAAPAHTFGWGYSASDAGPNLRVKWKELTAIKDNCHKWLNRVQGGKLIIKHIISTEYPHSAFLWQPFGSSVLWNLGCRCGRREASDYQLSDVAWHPSNKLQFIIQLCPSLLLFCFCMDNSRLLSCLEILIYVMQVSTLW